MIRFFLSDYVQGREASIDGVTMALKIGGISGSLEVNIIIPPSSHKGKTKIEIEVNSSMFRNRSVFVCVVL